MDSEPCLRTRILTAAQKVTLELQDDRIRLQLHPSVGHHNTGPFARALRRYIPEIKVEEWEPGEAGQPVAYSMERQLLTKYAHWARCLGVEEESLALPPWLRDSLEEQQQQQQQPEPSFFAEPRAQKLTEYQKRAIRFGVRRGGRLLLADDMGLGKSVQALGVAWQYQTSFPMLIICPTLLRKLWQQQISKWTPIPTKDVQEVNAGTTVLESAARAVIVAYEDLEKLMQLQNSKTGSVYKVLIADECHRIKTSETQISALVRIASVAQRMILVSSGAHMVLKSAVELYPLLQILDQNVGNDGSFMERYPVGLGESWAMIQRWLV